MQQKANAYNSQKSTTSCIEKIEDAAEHMPLVYCRLSQMLRYSSPAGDFTRRHQPLLVSRLVETYPPGWLEVV